MTKNRMRDDGLTITICADAGNRGAAYVGSTLAAEIAAAFGPRAESPLSVTAYDGDRVVGGINAATHWGWCYIRHLWVQQDRRRGGLGRRLLEEVTSQARSRQCAGLYVDTFDAGAATFYEQAGFVPYGRIDDFPPGHTRTFLQKRLVCFVSEPKNLHAQPRT